jgi:hypothetical protein
MRSVPWQTQEIHVNDRFLGDHEQSKAHGVATPSRIPTASVM